MKVFVAAVVGAGLLWTKRQRTDESLITASLLGSQSFGLIDHSMQACRDYLPEVPRMHEGLVKSGFSAVGCNLIGSRRRSRSSRRGL
jgi:hypothetical protein